MVDFRPLLFFNALALMLLVTAGFASVRQTLIPTPMSQPPAHTPVASPPAPPSAAREPWPAAAPPAVAGDKQTPARTELDAGPSEPPPPEALPSPVPKPTTATLVIRSNVLGDSVTINGRDYGATRLDLDLEPGRYDIVIRKPGFQPWHRQVQLRAGDETTLVGRLVALTTVDFRNGTWIGGIRTGDGTYQGDTGLRYQGQFVDGAFHGRGTAWFPDGSRYEGDWVRGKRSGEGLWRGADGAEYTGQFQDDRFHGKGTLTLTNGEIRNGLWAAGELNGPGSLTRVDGTLYVGGFRNGRFHGRGVLTYPDGHTYDGEFSNGAYHGAGTEVFADGKKYEGQYIDGEFHGTGRLSNPNGSSIEATFRHGKPYGQVRLTTAAGEIFTARTTEPGVCYRDKSYRATQCPPLEGW
ncbi:PEGA domain-containing protein [Marinobacter lutaoensis]|uniref:PEGA domain-containing protein n=1 Tax=Marinobacter lutaoensis TaxID=135739 RepID=A0A1V2DXI2_9GAMM|nr:PEGA domain-containing protein [Marinobacter lutaoensis]ONF45227.1 PEGA domain-containing protein [Marinobacter lutaoensis]